MLSLAHTEGLGEGHRGLQDYVGVEIVRIPDNEYVITESQQALESKGRCLLRKDKKPDCSFSVFPSGFDFRPSVIQVVAAVLLCFHHEFLARRSAVRTEFYSGVPNLAVLERPRHLSSRSA